MSFSRCRIPDPVLLQLLAPPPAESVGQVEDLAVDLQPFRPLPFVPPLGPRAFVDAGHVLQIHRRVGDDLRAPCGGGASFQRDGIMSLIWVLLGVEAAERVCGDHLHERGEQCLYGPACPRIPARGAAG